MHTRLQSTDVDAAVESERLTLESWNSWLGNPTDSGADIIFRDFSKSEFIMDNFLRLSKKVQNTVVFLEALHSVQVIEAYIKDSMNAGIDFDVAMWRHNLRAIFNGNRQRPSSLISTASFNRVFFEFTEHQALSKPVGNTSTLRSDHAQIAIYSLLRIYDERRILDAMRTWIDLDTSQNLQKFEIFVQQLDDYVDYPVDWAFSVIEASYHKKKVKSL